MTKEEVLKTLFFNEVLYVSNPYFFIRDYEDKGVLVLIKKIKDTNVSFKDLENVCFECPDLEQHPNVIKMVLFHLDKDNIVVSYSIASSIDKILRSDILKYEKIIGESIELR